jgi:hypothetical protein
MIFRSLFSRQKRDLREEDFPDRSESYIKEFDAPLVHTPDPGSFNWYRGKERPYDVRGLKPRNNCPAEKSADRLGVFNGISCL